MSRMSADEPVLSHDRACAGLDIVLVPRARDLGGFVVRRALPAAERRMVGPFIFWDQMGPAELAPGNGLDVRPHPHIGLSTLTYLFDGEMMHRDSLGNEIVIRPGELNWMTAGRGIVHSERTPQALRPAGSRLFGIQSWVALGLRDEEGPPSFIHHPASDLPVLDGEGKVVRIIAGELLGARSPVATSTPMFYADVELEAGASVPLDPDYDERAIYTVSGRIEIAGDAFEPSQLLVFKPGDRITVKAASAARLLMLGGEPMDGPRHIWWNFVASRRELIERGKAEWKGGKFPRVPNETEFIPLPDEPPRPVDYP